jgi:hypothetical protein
VIDTAAHGYYSNHKLVFDPSLVNFTVISGLLSIYTVNTSTPMHKFFPCIPSIQSLEWVETMPDDQMLGSSIHASASGRTPIYNSVWIQAQDANRTIEALIMESPKDMLAWIDLGPGITAKIRNGSPSWLSGQHVQVFYTTLTSNEEEVSWLRNCLVTPYSYNTVLTHLKASIHPYDDFLSIHEMMEEHGLISQQVTDESTEPTVTIFKSLDSSYGLCIFSPDTSWYTSLGKRVQLHSKHLRNSAVIMVPDYPSSLAIFTPNSLGDLSFILRHHLNATLPVRIMAAPRGGCWCISQLANPEQERRTKEGDVCT